MKRDGPRVVLGGAGQDFGRGGRGEQFGRQGVGCEVPAVVLVQPLRARLPRRRFLCARVGVLEDVRWAAGGGLGSVHDDECAWEWFT